MSSNKLLIVGPAWVGDMVMAQVLLKILRQQYPNADIHMLAPAWSEALTTRMPEVGHTIILPFVHGQLQLRERYRFGKSLRSEKYDQAYVLPNSWKSGIVPFFAGISKRTGWVGECRYGLLNDARKLDKKRLPKMSQRFAALAFARDSEMPVILPYPSLVPDIDNRAIAVQKHHLKTDQPVLVLCPGAEFGPSKCWPAEYYAEVAKQKLSEGWAVWLLGSAKDQVITDAINGDTQEQCVNLAGKTSLADAVDLLSLATCVVTNDSGLMHVAAALDRRVIVLYGSTSPEFTPPLSERATILKLSLDCQPCFQRVCPLKHHQCMKGIMPERVLSLIGGEGSASARDRKPWSGTEC